MGIEKCLVTTVFSLLQLSLLMDSTVPVFCNLQVNIRNIDGSTPLCDACSRGNVDIVNLLLQHGAHVNPPLTLSSPVHEAVLYSMC